MDPTLAQIYGTNQSADATDLEKLAADELAAGLAEDGGINVNDLSQDQIEAMAQEVLNDISAADGQGDKAENTDAADETDADDETLAKVAEADRLGRIMAHAMNQELVSIQKQAGAGQAVKNWAQLAAHGAKKGGEKVVGAAKAVASKGKEMGAKSVEHVKKHKSLYAAGAAGATGLGAGYAAGKKKKSSALDTLAQAHALEILKASGIDPDSLQLQQEKVSEADPAAALSNAVESRAWEILAQYGVTPSTED